MDKTFGKIRIIGSKSEIEQAEKALGDLLTSDAREASIRPLIQEVIDREAASGKKLGAESALIRTMIRNTPN